MPRSSEGMHAIDDALKWIYGHHVGFIGTGSPDLKIPKFFLPRATYSVAVLVQTCYEEYQYAQAI